MQALSKMDLPFYSHCTRESTQETLLALTGQADRRRSCAEVRAMEWRLPGMSGRGRSEDAFCWWKDKEKNGLMEKLGFCGWTRYGLSSQISLSLVLWCWVL